MSRLHVFDMDGTLLEGSASLEISRALGVFDETMAIEEAWSRGEITDNGFWQRCLPLWRELTDERIDAAFSASRWIDGVDRVFADIRERGEESVVISQSPRFFVERLVRRGAGYAHGAIVSPGNAAGADELVSSEDKLRITDELLAHLGLRRDDCIAYGDSLSDLALFETLEFTVAVNAREPIRKLGRVAYDGTDLWDAYLAGRRLMDAAPCTAGAL